MRIYSLILFFIFTSSFAFALEYNDIVDSKILKVYNGNVLILNRGLEDAIMIKDHMKLTSSDGFIARGICIKSGMLSSHWKIYRVVHPELVSKDTTYKLRSMNQSEIPPEYLKYQNQDFSGEYTEWNEKDLKKQLKLQQKRFATFTLPTDNLNDNRVIEANKPASEQFFDKNFDAEQLAEDFTNYDVSIFASPISKQTLNDQEDINYGMSFSNMGEKYEFSFEMSENQSKSVDPYTQIIVTSKGSMMSMSFDVKEIVPDWSYFMNMNYEQSRFGNLYTPRTYWSGGILGLRHHLYKGDILQDFTLSYITLIEVREDDFEEPAGYDAVGNEKDPVIKQNKSTNIRHDFKLSILFQFTPDFSVKNNTSWSPYMLIDTRETDFDDVKLENDFTMSFKLTEKLFTDFNYKYTYDITQWRLNSTEHTNHIYSLNLRYDFQI